MSIQLSKKQFDSIESALIGATINFHKGNMSQGFDDLQEIGQIIESVRPEIPNSDTDNNWLGELDEHTEQAF